jgi:hypothetical protein
MHNWACFQETKIGNVIVCNGIWCFHLFTFYSRHNITHLIRNKASYDTVLNIYLQIIPTKMNKNTDGENEKVDKSESVAI